MPSDSMRQFRRELWTMQYGTWGVRAFHVRSILAAHLFICCPMAANCRCAFPRWLRHVHPLSRSCWDLVRFRRVSFGGRCSKSMHAEYAKAMFAKAIVTGTMRHVFIFCPPDPQLARLYQELTCITITPVFSLEYVSARTFM